MQTIRKGALLLSAILGFSAPWALAQNYPARPVHIHTASAGGGTDFVARLLAGELSGPLGQPVVVENRSSGALLGSGVAKAAPDGYTLLLWGGGFWLGPLFDEMPYDVIRDFAPITTLTRSPYIMVVHPSVPVKTVSELIKLAKAKPGQLNYSSGTTGSSSHIAGELLKSMAGADIVRIAYKAQAQETADLLSGQIQMTFSSGNSVEGQVKSGKLRALASGGTRRSLLFPDLPTVAESLPGFASESLFGLFAPGKTPEAMLRRLNQETGRVLEKADVREKFLKTGQEPVGGTPEQLWEAIKSETARVSKLIKDGAIKPGS